MKKDFVKGQKVFDIRYGWGVVQEEGDTWKSIKVAFMKMNVYYSRNETNIMLLCDFEYELTPKK